MVRSSFRGNDLSIYGLYVLREQGVALVLWEYGREEKK